MLTVQYRLLNHTHTQISTLDHPVMSTRKKLAISSLSLYTPVSKKGKTTNTYSCPRSCKVMSKKLHRSYGTQSHYGKLIILYCIHCEFVNLARVPQVYRRNKYASTHMYEAKQETLTWQQLLLVYKPTSMKRLQILCKKAVVIMTDIP